MTHAKMTPGRDDESATPDQTPGHEDADPRADEDAPGSGRAAEGRPPLDELERAASEGMYPRAVERPADSDDADGADT